MIRKTKCLKKYRLDAIYIEERKKFTFLYKKLLTRVQKCSIINMTTKTYNFVLSFDRTIVIRTTLCSFVHTTIMFVRETAFFIYFLLHTAAYPPALFGRRAVRYATTEWNNKG